MMRHKLSWFILLLVLLGTSMPVMAQGIDVNNIDFQSILRALGPRTGNLLVLDLLLYGTFIMAFITMVLVPDKQLFVSMLMIMVLGLLVVAKLDIFDGCTLPVLVINVGIFVVPLIVAGMVRTRGKTPRALWPAIITGALGGGYFFLFWALLQQNCQGAAI